MLHHVYDNLAQLFKSNRFIVRNPEFNFLFSGFKSFVVLDKMLEIVGALFS